MSRPPDRSGGFFISPNQKIMKTNKNIQITMMSELNQFSGTTQYYLHITGYYYTDGVHHLAENYHCYWLLTEILIANYPRQLEEFQIWKLERCYKTPDEPTDVFTLTMEDGDKNNCFTKHIPFSDFTGDCVELWFTNDVLYLPSEH